MTDSMTLAQAVIDKVKAELTPIWLGGRQRMMLKLEIAAALDAVRKDTWEKAAKMVESNHIQWTGIAGYSAEQTALMIAYQCRVRAEGVTHDKG